MTDDIEVLGRTLRRTRARWRRLTALRAVGRWSSAAALVLFLTLSVYWLLLPSDGWLLVLAAAGLGITVGLLVPAARASMSAPADRQVARFVEERCPELEDRLASAAEYVETELKRPRNSLPGSRLPASGFSEIAPEPALLEPGARSPQPITPQSLYGPRVVADAARRLEGLDFDRVVDQHDLRKASVLTVASLLALCLVAYVGRQPAARAFDLATMYAFPGRVQIAVSPGNVRLPAGQALVVRARVTGAPQVTPQLELVSGSARRALSMHAARDPETYEITLDGVTAAFEYFVEAGSTRSDTYDVSVIYPPRVKRIDLRYTYPKAFGLQPRVEENGGDIYGPAGTRVTVDVHADKPLRDAALVLADGKRLALSAGQQSSSAQVEIELTEDTSYRLALHDRDGLRSHGETEYFVRLLSDRPPDVRILQPVGDTQVTALEEVTIEARADDDHGIEGFELVYAVRGGEEQVAPFAVDKSQPTAEGARVLYMEDLGVRPGDFVTYFARARDISRGKRSTEVRSDIFFLEVKGYEEEFSLAQSQAMAGGGGGTPFEDLAAAQKEIIIATWKLDRRALDGQSGRSADDVKAVATAQGQLRLKTEQVAQIQSGAAARRRRLRVGGEETAEHPLALAVQAMTRAETALGRLDTKNALPPEMEALNQLLRAQAEIRRTQISRQQAGGGMGGSGRQGQDLSALFDRELQRQQQTNYENPTSSEHRRDADDRNDALDKVRELARRQEALAKQQEELARQRSRLSEEELKRQLERLTREQSELRRQAEQLSQQMAPQPGQRQSQSQGRGRGSGAAGRGESNQNDRLREISEEMGHAANELRREDLERASTRSGRASDLLRQLEQRLGANQPNDRARQLGDVQLEARQLADAQQRIGAEAGRMTKGTSADALRRLAGEKERLADRTGALTEAVKRATGNGGGEQTSGRESQALADALQQLEAQQLDRQMREGAGRLRRQGEAAAQAQRDQKAGQSDAPPRLSDAEARREQQLAQTYERLADRLGGATARADAEANRLADEIAKTQELRQRWEQLSRDHDRLRQEADRQGRAAGPGRDGEGGRQGSEGPAGRQGSGAGAGGGTDLAKLREEHQRQLQHAEELMKELRQSMPGGAGTTPEGQQMVTSAPGTEAFKQDFAKWDQLRKMIESTLDHAERTLSETLRERQARDRLNAGAGEQTPEQYRKWVEKYFQALARKK
ncbi:MAG: hypothetical protein HY654_08675 [Acidobacteria bacterium]|nr:hypothetical protein [Acidobacteriota bacterium]